MGNPLHDADELFKSRFYDRVFLATVSGVSGNRVSVKRPGQNNAEGPYPATAGLAATLIAGDKVLVLVTGGIPIVVQEIVT